MPNSAFDDVILDASDLDVDFGELYHSAENKDKSKGVILPQDIIEGRVPDTTDDNDDDDLDIDDPKSGKKPSTKKPAGSNPDENMDLIDSLFDDNDNPDDDDDDDDDDKTKGKGAADKGDAGKLNTPFAKFYNLMVEEGIWEKDETFDGSETSFEAIKEKNLEKMRQDDLDAYIETAFEKNPDGKQLGRELIDHLAKGGRIADFVMLNETADIKEEDLTSDSDTSAVLAAKRLVTSYMTLSGQRPEIIQKLIDKKIADNSIVSYAKDIFEPHADLVASKKEEEKELLKQEDDKRRNNAIKYRSTVVELINKGGKIKNYQLPEDNKEKKALSDYMLSPSVEVGDKKISQFNADFQTLVKEPDFNVFLAQAIRSWKNKKQSPSNTDAPSDKASRIRKLLGDNDDQTAGRRTDSAMRSGAGGASSAANGAWNDIF